MKWIEVIEVRLFNRDRRLMESQLIQLKTEVMKEAGSEKIEVFSRFMLDSDFAVHLFHQSENISLNGSPLAAQISAVLEEFGQVNQKIWIELIQETNS